MEDPVLPSEITKQQRERIGDRVQVAIAQLDAEFPILPNVPPFDTTVYWYVQTLYNQSSNLFRIGQPEEEDGWRLNRDWLITILDTDEQMAFGLPGGHFYISTGLLRSIDEEHELYYILSFEANLMESRTLLNRIIEAYNTRFLTQLAEGQLLDMEAGAQSMARSIPLLDFEMFALLENDRLTVEHICRTSAFQPMGIMDILRGEQSGSWPWLAFRSYSGRQNLLYSFSPPNENECGEFRTNGNYQRYILDVLD